MPRVGLNFSTLKLKINKRHILGRTGCYSNSPDMVELLKEDQGQCSKINNYQHTYSKIITYLVCTTQPLLKEYMLIISLYFYSFHNSIF